MGGSEDRWVGLNWVKEYGPCLFLTVVHIGLHIYSQQWHGMYLRNKLVNEHRNDIKTGKRTGHSFRNPTQRR